MTRDPLLAALRSLYTDERIAAALSTSERASERNRALRRWETGAYAPRLETLRRLATELGVELTIGPVADRAVPQAPPV